MNHEPYQISCDACKTNLTVNEILKITHYDISILCDACRERRSRKRIFNGVNKPFAIGPHGKKYMVLTKYFKR